MNLQEKERELVIEFLKGNKKMILTIYLDYTKKKIIS